MDEESALKIEESLIKQPDMTVLMITHHLREEIGDHLDGVLDLKE